VDASDFALTTAGSLSGVSVTSVSGSGSTYSVTVSTGTGTGTLRLDVIDNDTIIDAAGNPLGGSGFGNGNFTDGEIYTIQKAIFLPLIVR
jgi:MSHA biogenesis protein MshQ